ncbi:MAG: efflux RND transporter permease subunit [Nevskia sp.]|nr:efflux RND transporter permease subunit [Nevskia sp.]
MSNTQGQALTFTQKILRFVEPIIFGRRRLMLVVLGLITLFFGVEAMQAQIDAGWLKMVPLSHPYMQVFRKYYKDFGSANTVLIELHQKQGDIYNEKFLNALEKVTDDVFLMPGVDRSHVLSLFTPNVYYLEVTEDGLAGSNVIPANYQPSPEMFAKVRSNVAKASVIGRLVSKDEKGAMVVAELLDDVDANSAQPTLKDFVEKGHRINAILTSPEHKGLREVAGQVWDVVREPPSAGGKLSYQAVAQRLEQIRHTYETDNIEIHIVGFAKVVGDLSDAALEVVGFFFVALILTSLLLWLYVGSLRLAMLPMGCAIVCIIWEFGALRAAGFGLDPFAMLVPFLVLAVSVSHGVQYVNSWADEVAKGESSYNASLYTFRALAIAGTIAILADVAGVATIYLIPIEIIREMSLNAVFGMLAIIITNKVLMPIWLSYVKLGDVEGFKRAQAKREAFGDTLWRRLAKVTHPKPALTVLVISGALLGWAVWMYPKLQIGDVQAGVPELRPNSRLNQDARVISDNYAIGIDMFKVIAEGKPDGCVDYDEMAEIDHFSWRMENTAGVQGVMSLLTYAKVANSGLNEMRLNAEVVPRNPHSLVAATSLLPPNKDFANTDCSALPVFIFTQDHRAQTIAHIVDEVKRFNAQNKADGGEVNFALASGNVGVMAASNEVVKAQEYRVVLWVYAVIIVFLFLSYRTLSGVLCVILPLGLVSALGYAFMILLGIGMKVSTLPVVSLAVGIGVDYGIYIYSMLSDGIRRGLSIEEAYYQTLRRTGKAVIFIGVALGSTVSTWLFSKIQFQADMGVLLVFLFTANMFGAIIVLPAFAHYLADEEKKHAGKPTLIGH